jgi:FkbM family methyltransferase
MSLRKLTLNSARLAARWLPQSVKQSLYRHSNLAQLIRRRLNEAAPTGLTKVEIAAEEAAGLTFMLDLQSEKDYWLGTYEPDLQSALIELVKPGMVAYDVGANIGYISLMFARRVGSTGRVVAFEALPANVSRLAQNISLNNIGERVLVVPKAVADHPGETTFWIAPSGAMGKISGSAGRSTSTYSGSIQVESTSIDEMVFRESLPSPQVIKIDIEGGEVLAFPGMKKTLIAYQPLILIEVHGSQAAQVTWGSLVPAGYRLCWMKAGFPELPAATSIKRKGYLVCFPPGGEG